MPTHSWVVHIGPFLEHMEWVYNHDPFSRAARLWAPGLWLADSLNRCLGSGVHLRNHIFWLQSKAEAILTMSSISSMWGAKSMHRMPSVWESGAWDLMNLQVRLGTLILRDTLNLFWIRRQHLSWIPALSLLTLCLASSLNSGSSQELWGAMWYLKSKSHAGNSVAHMEQFRVTPRVLVISFSPDPWMNPLCAPFISMVHRAWQSLLLKNQLNPSLRPYLQPWYNLENY